MAITTTRQLVAAVKKYGTLKGVARKTSTSWNRVHTLYEQALAAGLMDALPLGRDSKKRKLGVVGKIDIGGRRKALKAKPIERHPDKVTRFLFTCAQNNTKIHEAFWENLLKLKAFYNAELHVSRFAYIRSGLGARGDKENYFAAKEDFKLVQDFWFDDRIVPYISDMRREVAPGLVWCGEANIMPTAAKPLSGLQTFTGRKSGIFPHVKIAMESVPCSLFEPTKFNYTTGTVTLRNYIQRKEGLKAEFHHCYGALLVEVEPNGDWWCRQLNADSEGTIYDLDLVVKGAEVTTFNPNWKKRTDCTFEPKLETTEGAKWGDIHERQMDPSVRKAIWGKGGILDYLHPKYQFFDDSFDMFARNHHEMDDPHTMYERWLQSADSVRDEGVAWAAFLHEASRPFTHGVVVNSNHDRALMRWLKDRRAQFDPPNMAFWHRLNDRVVNFMQEHIGQRPIILEECYREVTGCEPPKNLQFLKQGAEFIICPSAGGGVDNGQHGDDGPNGSRGSTAVFARIGRKMNKGHDHSAAIVDSVSSSGCCLDLKNPPSYQTGPSSSSNSHILTYKNGKRAILTQWGDEKKAWADR